MDTSAIERNGKIFLLAYDQGLQHGPTIFNDKNYSPNYIYKIAQECKATCITMQYGLAKQTYTKELRAKLPLILKINGKTRLNSQNYKYAITASIEEAKNLGAVGIGFAVYPGQTDEHIGFEQFAQIREICEKEDLITVLWSYARGPEIENQFDTDVVSYATRVAAELGADVVKVKYTGDPESFKWAVKNAINTKVLISGTDNFPTDIPYPEAVEEAMKSGASGIAVGRKIWQDENPMDIGKQVAAKLFNS